MSPSKLNRIAIIGRPGSGKSTFALGLSIQLSVPAFHLDKIFFTENWIKRDSEQFIELQQNWINLPQWIIDGNSLKSLEMRYKTADMVIVFLLPKWKCLWRIIKRRYQQKNPLIDDRAPNCQEHLSLKLLDYAWSFEDKLFPILNELQDKHPHTKLIFITSDQQKTTLLNTLGNLGLHHIK